MEKPKGLPRYTNTAARKHPASDTMLRKCVTYMLRAMRHAQLCGSSGTTANPPYAHVNHRTRPTRAMTHAFGRRGEFGLKTL